MAQTGGLRSFAGTRASGEKRGDHSFVTRGLVMHWPAVLASANANASCDHFEKTLAATFAVAAMACSIGCTGASSVGKPLQLLEAQCQREDGSRLSPRN